VFSPAQDAVHDQGGGRSGQGGAESRRQTGGGKRAVKTDAQRDDRGRHQRKAGHDQTEKSALGIRGRVLFRVERLEFLHGLKAQRRAGVAQAEQVGADGHGDRPHGGMIFRYTGKKALEHGPQQTGHLGRQAGLFRHFHQTRPEGDGADEADSKSYGPFGGTKNAVGYGLGPSLDYPKRDTAAEQDPPDEVQHGTITIHPITEINFALP